MLRSIRRNAVKHAMKRQGMQQMCKRTGQRGHGSKNIYKDDSGQKSYFAAHWRNYR